VRVARSGEEKKWKRRVAENAELILLVVLRGQSKSAHHVDGSTGTNNDRTITGTNSTAPPAASYVGLLVTNQLWMVVLRIRIQQFY
jgi:hypothetical protein